MSSARSQQGNRVNKLQDIQKAFLTGKGENNDYIDKETRNINPDGLSDKKSTIAHS